MGSHCSFCKDPSDVKSHEVIEQKRERFKLQSENSLEDKISLRSYSIHSNLNITGFALCRTAKRYLSQKYFKISHILYISQLPYKLFFSPIPHIPEEESKFNLTPNSHLYLKSQKLIVLPSIILTENSLYEGQWNLDSLKPEGFGILLEKDQGKYIGHFLAGLKHGKGRFISKQGTIYEGEFSNNSIEGNGVLKKGNGLVYIGSFKDGKEHGQGVIECDGEEIYTGGFSEGLKQGKGKLKICEGSYYIGEFFKGFMHGQGIYVWPDGKKYEGGWKENLIHGEGKYTWPDRSEYFGCYKNGNRDGYGVFKWPDGREYRGEWKMGVMHGIGSYRCMDKEQKFSVVKGVWENGKKVK